ncbi:unnamed protein product [Staurois parvus]|uniref:Uncharacterized protein n=1 Tax=Staurois parvus TaxID=386267 RepID=A0ABN9FGN0_9NEOB|nr:unnamed protein product [Staurois parvus]
MSDRTLRGVLQRRPCFRRSRRAEEGLLEEHSTRAARGQCSRCHPAVVSPGTQPCSSIGWARSSLPLPRSLLTPTANGRWVRQTQTVSWHGPGSKPTEITCPLDLPLSFGVPHQAKYRMLWAQPHCTVRKS